MRLDKILAFKVKTREGERGSTGNNKKKGKAPGKVRNESGGAWLDLFRVGL